MPNRLTTFRQRYAKPLAAGALLSAMMGAGPVSANPSGATVRSGNVNITNVAPGTLHIEQLTNKAIIDWQKFGIGAGETVRFLQPSQLSAVLNRVVGQDPTKILGNLTANGQVFIVNPNGVLFGPNSQVNVGGLVASTLNITNDDFLNGNYRFTQDQNADLASVVNQGSITITDGGYAVLVAPMVSNEGMIVANLGQVNLMSGESATLNFDGRNLINYDIGHMDAATPGTVVVDRSTVSSLLANVIQDPNLTEAGELIENADGSVSLVGGAGTVINEGTIQANGAAGKDAGKIVLDSGRLTVVGSEAVVEASGDGVASNGGEIIALSHGTLKTLEGSTIAARGSDKGGDGGYIDTSGYGRIILEDYADATAPNGEGGTWLIDPDFLAVVSGGGGQLDGNTNTTGLGGQSSSISEDFLEGLSGAQTVILQADEQVTINDLADNLLQFQADVSVSIISGTGNIVFADPGDGIQTSGTGGISINAGQDLFLGSLESTGTGVIDITFARDLIDGNGAGTDIRGDFLTFGTTADRVTNLQAQGGGAIEIAGVTNANPLEINLNLANNAFVDLDSAGGASINIRTGGVANNAITTGDFQTAPGTDININKIGSLTLNGLQAEDVTVDVTNDINGGAAATDLAANSATLIANDDINNVDTDVAVLNLETDGGGGSNISVDTTDGTLTDLTATIRGGTLTVDGQTVLSGNDLVGYDQTLNGPGTHNFTIVEETNRDLNIGTAAGVTVLVDSFSLTTGGSIFNPLAGIIESNDITLISGGDIGEFGPPNGNLLGPFPVLVQGIGGGPTALNAQVDDGSMNIEHTGGSTFTYNDPNPPAVANVLNGNDPGGLFTNLSFTNLGTNDILLDVINVPGGDVTITSVGGDILDFNVGALNVTAGSVQFFATAGTVGTLGDPIEVDVSSVGGQGANGFFVTSIGELEVFDLIVDGGSDALIGAANGTLQFLSAGNQVSTTTPITDTDGEQNADGYDVTVNVTLTTGDLNIDGVNVDGNGGVNDGANGRALVNMTAQNGSLVSNGGGSDLTVGDDTDVNLRASAGVGTPGAGINITSTADSAGELLIDAVTEIDIDLDAGDFDVITLQHDNADVFFQGTGPQIDHDGVAGGLALTGTGNVSTINYINRTADIPLGLVTAAGSDVNITAQAGSVTGTVDGTDDIVAGANTVTVNATGDFSADASSAAGSLEIGTVGGDVTLRNNAGLNLNAVAAGNIGGNLDFDNDAQLTLGGATFVGLTVGGAATVTNSNNFEDAIVGFDGQVDLAATSLTVTADAPGTLFGMTTRITDFITFNDCVADGGGNAALFIAANDGAFNTLTVNSDSTNNFFVSTDPSGATETVTLADGTVGGTDAQIATINIDEKTDNVTTAGTASFNNTIDVTINASNGTLTGDYDVTAGVGDKNLTLLADGLINVTTTVQDTLTITSQTGTITFTDDQTDGPDDLIVTTFGGDTVDGEWDAGASTMDFNGATDVLLITDTGGADTNVTFETVTGDIALDFADTGFCENDLNIFSAGAISDVGASGPVSGAGNLDVRAMNATLLAVDDIGTSVDPLEVDVCDTLTARSDTGGVFLTSIATVDHVIIDVDNSDFSTTFQEYGGGAVTIDYTTGGATNTIGATGTFSGTDLTVIERNTGQTIDVITDLDNTGDADGNIPGPGTDQEFIRLISGGSVTRTGNVVIRTDNADVIAETGNIGAAGNAILFAVQDLCVSANGRDVQGFVENDVAVRNLYLSVNQSNGGAGDVSVIWPTGATAEGVRMSGATLNTVSDAGGTAATAGNADVVVVNGAFDLDGEFDVDPSLNDDSFFRVSDSLEANSGGDVIIGTYESTGNLEVQARGVDVGGVTTGTTAGGDIIQGVGGSIDVGSNQVTLVSEHGAIGTTTAAIQIDSSNNDTVVNAYTENESNVTGGDITGDEAGDININSTGDVVFNQVISGTDLTFIAPFHDNDAPAFTSGGVIVPGNGSTPGNPVLIPGGTTPPTPPREGDVIVTATGEICANDVRGGADSDVMVESTGAGDILIQTISANDGTVTVTNASGNIDEKNDDLNGNIFAQEFVGNITGTGTIGNDGGPAAADKLRESLDIVTLEASLDVADGDVYLRNIGNIIYNQVRVEDDSTTGGSTGEVYLVSEGVTTAGDIIVGENVGLNQGDVDILIETRNGSPLLVGNVQARGNTVAIKSADDIRTNALDINDVPFANQGRVQADNVLLLANGNIATAANPMQLFASNPGGTVTLAASTLDAATNPDRGSIFIDAGSAGFATDVVIGTVTDTICNLTETGVIDAANICIDAVNGEMDIQQVVTGTGSIALEASGDVTMGATVTSSGNNQDIGIESTGGNIVDNNGAGDNIVTNDGDIALRAGGAIGVNGGGADDAIEIRNTDNNTIDFAADAQGGNVNVDIDVNGGELDVENFSGGGNPLKDNTAINGVSSTGNICLDIIGGSLDLNSTVSGGGDIFLAADGNIAVDSTISTTAGGATVVLEAQGGSITDGNNNAMNIDAGFGGTVILNAVGGGVGSAAGGGTEDALEIDALNLTAFASNGDININDIDNDSDGLVLQGDSYQNKAGGTETFVDLFAADDVCIETQNGGLAINANVQGAGDDVALEADGDIVFNGVAQVIAADDVGIESVSGSILDALPAVTDPNTDIVAGDAVVLRAGGGIGNDALGTDVDKLEIEGQRFAAQAAGDVQVANTGATPLEVTGFTNANSPLKGTGAVIGVISGGNVCIEGEANAVTVSQNITAAGNIGIGSGGDITLGSGTVGILRSTGGGTISIETDGGSIQDGNGVTDNLVTTGDLVLFASGGVGSDAAGNNDDVLEISASRLAANATTGDVNLEDLTGQITLFAGTTEKDLIPVVGINAGIDVCLDVIGAINVNEDVTAGRFVEIRATNGDITINEEDSVVGGSSRIQAGDRVSLATNRDLIDNNDAVDGTIPGDMEAVVVTNAGGIIVLEANTVNGDSEGLAATPPANAFHIATDQLAANIAGDLNVFDDNGFTSGSGKAAKRLANIDGITAAGEICFEVGGDYTVDADIVSTGGDIGIIAGGNIILGDGVGDGLAGGNDTESLIANALNATISLEAGGEVINNNDAIVAASTVDDASLQASNVVIDSGTGVGNGGTDIGIAASTVAVDGGTGDVNLVDLDNAGLTVSRLFTAKVPGNEVVGVTADGDICIDVRQGNLRLNEEVNADGANSIVALRMDGDLQLNNSAATILSATDKVSIESINGSITQNLNNNVADIQTTAANGQIVIRTQSQIGAPGANNELEIDTDQLAVLVAGGGEGAYIEDLNGDLLITDIMLEKGGANILGVQASGEVCVTSAGAMTLESNVTSLLADVALGAGGDVTIGDGGAQVLITSGPIDGQVSIESGGEIINANAVGDSNIAADDIVLVANDGIGNAQDIEIEASNPADIELTLAANGDANNTDTAGEDVNIIARGDNVVLDTLFTGKNNIRVDGVETGGDVCIDVLDGSLTLTQGIGNNSNPDNIALRAQDNIDFNNATNVTLEAVNTISIRSQNGGIVGTVDDAVADLRTTAAGGSIVISTDDAIGSAAADVDIETDLFAAETRNAAAAGIFVEDLTGNLTITELTLAKGDGPVTGVQTVGEVCVETVAGDLTVERIVLGGDRVFLAAAGDINNNIVDGGASTGENIQAANANGFVILEAGDEITDGSNDDNVTNGGGVVADNVVLSSVNGVGNSGAGGDMEVSATNLAAISTTGGDVNIDENSLTATNIVALTYNNKAGAPQTVTGVSAAADVCIDTADALNINENVVSGTGGAASEAAIRAAGTVTIGDGVGVDQVRNATAANGNRISIEATAGDIVDNNGVGNAATDANGGNVVLSAAAGTIGTTDFAGAGADVAFEMNARQFAATSGDDVNVLDLDTNADGLVITDIALGKGGGNVTGVTAANDICIDVVNGGMNIQEAVVATAGSVAIRTQNANNTFNSSDQLQVGADVTAVAAGQTVSIESGFRLQDSLDGAGTVSATNVVLLARNRIRASDASGGVGFEVDAANIAAQNTAGGEINLEITNSNGADVTVTELVTLKDPANTVTGINAAADVCVDVMGGDNLQINEDVQAGTDVHLEVDGSVTIGNDANDEVRSRGNGRTVVIDAGGNITDNNGANNAAIEALGGDVILRSGGNIESSTAGQPFDIDAEDLAAQAAAGSINILDVDSNDDGLDIEELTFNNKAGVLQTVTGVTAMGDICVDVFNGSLDVNDVVTSAAGSVALRTQDNDNDDDANINLNGVAGEDVSAATIISLESANQIVDTVDGGGVLIAPNLVMLADTGIGETGGEVETDVTNLAANSVTSGDVNIEDGRVSNTNAGLNVVEALSTIKNPTAVSGITSQADICLDVVDDLSVQADITAGQNVAIESNTNIVLGDTAGAQTGLITSGNNNVDSTVSIEAGGAVTDGNDGALNIRANSAAAVGGGDLVVDSGSFGVADFVTPANSNAIEIDVARIAGQATAGDFNVQDITGNLEVAEGLSTLKTPTTFSGITSVEDICVDVLDATGNLFVNADVTADGPGVNNIALAAGNDVNLGDAAGAQAGVVRAGADAAGGNTGTVSVEARAGMIQDGQQDDALVLVDNIVNRGGNTVLRSATGVGGEDDLLAGARPDDEIEVDTTNFAAAGGTGDVRVHDLDTDADGLNLVTINTLKDDVAVVGIITAVDICITVDNTDINVIDDLTAGGNVALRTNLNINLGDSVNGDGIITAGNDANRVGTISLEAVTGSVTDQNGANANLIALGDGGATATGGDIVINAGGGIGDADEIETDTLNFAALAAGGDVNIDELDTNTQDGLTIGAVSTIKQGGVLITGVTATADVCIDVNDGDLRINEDILADSDSSGGDGDIALRTEDATPAAGSNGDIIIGNDPNAADEATADTVITNGTDRLISVEATGDVIDNNGQGNVALSADNGDNGRVVIFADSVTATDDGNAADTDALEIRADALSGSAVGGTNTGNFHVDDLTGDLRIERLTTLKGGQIGPLLLGLAAVDDICVDVLNGSLTVNEGIDGGNDVSLRAAQDVTLGNSGAADFGGMVVAGYGDDLMINTADDAGGTVSVEAIAGSIIDGNGDALAFGLNIIATGAGAGPNGGNVVLVAGAGIGDADDIEIDTLNFAANGGTGDVNVVEQDLLSQDGLTIAELTTGKNVTQTVTGVTAGVDVCIDVLDGDLRINEDVTAGNNVALRTQDATPVAGSNGDIIFGDDSAAADQAAADTVTAGATVSVEASGDVVDNNGAGNAAIITPGSVVITGDDIASVNNTDAFEIQAAVLAARADTTPGVLGGTGNVFIDDLTGDLQIDAVTPLKGGAGARVVGVTAEDDICIEVLQGSLDVDEAVVAGDNVALRANGNVDLGDTAAEGGESFVVAGADTANGMAGTVSVEATAGDIIDGNNNGIVANSSNIIALGAAGGGGNVVLKASGGIGSDNTGSDASENDLEIDTLNFAAQADTGDVNIVETDILTGDGLTIAQIDTLKGPVMTVTGVSAGDDVCIDVLDGDMRINENITANVVDDATAGDVALRAVDGNVFFGDNTAVGGDAAAEVVSATGAGSVVSVEALGAAIDDNGDGVAAINTDRGGVVDNGSVVFVVDSVIDNALGEFELQTGTIAGQANGPVLGNFLVEDLTGNLDIGTVTTGKTDVAIQGIFATNNVCVDVLNGDLDVNEAIFGFNSVQLRTGSAGVDEQDVRVNSAGGVGAFGLVSINATGDILDNNGAGNFAAASVGGTVVLDGDSVTSSTTTEAFEITAPALAGRATDGRFHVTDLDLADDGLALVGTPVPGANDKFVQLTNITATQDICIDVVNGDMNVNVDVTAGTEVALRTQDGDMDNDGNVNVNNTATVTANGGRVTVDAAEDIVDNNGNNDAAFVASTNVVMDAGDEIRATNPADAFEIEAAGLAARAGTNGINVADLSGNLQIVQDTTIKGNALIDGVTAPGDICLDVRAGDMDVAQQVTSANGNVALQATGSITLSGADSVAANRATGTVSVEAGTEVADTGAGSFTGQNVVFESTTGVGNNNTVTIEADNLAAAGGTGRVDIQDTAGGVRVTSLNTLKGGDPIVGVTAAQDVCLQATGGDLAIDEVINAGTIAAITADGNIASNATTTGTNKVSVAAGGDITDGNGNGTNNFVGSDVVISAGGNIGADGNLIDIDSDRVAAQSTNGRVHLNETAGNMNVATLDLEKNGGTVAGINAGTDICLTADDGTVTYTGQTIEADNEIAIRTRDTLVTGGRLVTGVNGDGNTGRVSIEVTNGGVTDGNVGFDIESADAVISANGNVGSTFNPIDTNVDRLAVNGADINIYEVDGLKITSLDLAKAAGTVNGMIATGDIRVEVGDGDLELERVESTGTTSNGDIALQANRGNILDCNGNDPNIVTPGDVDLTAPNGCVGENGDLLEINAGGTVTIIEKNPNGDPNDGVSTDFRPINVDQIIVRVFPPGTFAQDNYQLGETSFYLDVLYGWLEPEELELIIDELNAYDYTKDGDFLLEKHPVNERDNNKEN